MKVIGKDDIASPNPYRCFRLEMKYEDAGCFYHEYNSDVLHCSVGLQGI